jgi:transposase
MIPIRPGDRIKTNRRDAITLARLHRAGELTPVWVPDEAHEAVRDLVRAREGAMLDLRMKRQQLTAFLLRHDRIFPGRKSWPQILVAGSCPLAVRATLRPSRPSDRDAGIPPHHRRRRDPARSA